MKKHKLSKEEFDFLLICKDHSLYRKILYNYQDKQYLCESDYKLVNGCFLQWHKLTQEQKKNQRFLHQILGIQNQKQAINLKLANGIVR